MTTKPSTARPDVSAVFATHGAGALAQLQALSPSDSETNSKMGEVMRCFVALRDNLILAKRAGIACEKELQEMNAIMSSIFGMEFPSEGLQWQRVCDTRDAFCELLRKVSPEA